MKKRNIIIVCIVVFVLIVIVSGICINITFSGNRCDVNGTEYSIKNNIDKLIHIYDSYF